MSSAAMERRVAPRFAVRCTGELASGTTVTAVAISDMSVTGCGIEVPSGGGDGIGRLGVLSIHAADGKAPPLMLPVMTTHQRVEGGTARFGLQFRRLTTGQMRGLIGVLDGVIDK